MALNPTRNAWRKSRIEQGLCVDCGDPLPNRTYRACQRCRKRRSRYFKTYAKTDKGAINHKQNVLNWQRSNRDKVAAAGKKYRAKVRDAVFGHYGTACACCGEAATEFLSIDHIENGGNIHRRQLFGSQTCGCRFYAWLRRNGFPAGYQTLCFNCNHAKAIYGTCPHTVAAGPLSVGRTSRNPSQRQASQQPTIQSRLP